MRKVLFVDNHDSFSFNVVQALRVLGAEVHVFENDAIDARGAQALRPSHLVVSPGPGRPERSGASRELIEHFLGRIPILGVCLGHQALAQVLGARVERGSAPVHGKATRVFHDGRTVYEGLPNPFEAGRYHSLVVLEQGLPPEIEVSAYSAEGEILGIRHRGSAAEGVQFHPESLLTPEGPELLANFLDLAAREAPSREAQA